MKLDKKMNVLSLRTVAIFLILSLLLGSGVSPQAPSRLDALRQGVKDTYSKIVTRFSKNHHADGGSNNEYRSFKRRLLSQTHGTQRIERN